MAASDKHAKNYSLFLRSGDAYAMTPLYDVISVWPYIGDAANQFLWRSAGLAMAVRAKNAHYAFHAIRTRHWHALAMKNGGASSWQAMLTVIDHVDRALATVESRLPRSFPDRTWDTIQAGARSQLHSFIAGLSGLEGD